MWTQQCRGDRYEKVGGGSSEVKATHSHDLSAQMFTSDSGIDHIVHAAPRWPTRRACLSAAVYYFKVRSLRTGLTGIKQERRLSFHFQSSCTF